MNFTKTTKKKLFLIYMYFQASYGSEKALNFDNPFFNS